MEKLENGEWIDYGDYPFVTEYIAHYSMATLNDELYLFGGEDGEILLTQATKYDGENWVIVGDMLNGRRRHRSIVKDNTIMHVGGYPGTQYV